MGSFFCALIENELQLHSHIERDAVPVINCGDRSTLPEQCRCECGNLLAKMVLEGIEVKCRRCKRIVLIRFTDIEGYEQPSQRR
jgi:phage FluMu protein Com